jgi:ABC-type lipoprotein release transport system permease subunit
MIGRAIALAWLRVRREPGRLALGVAGVTAIGALLFDMLLLSNGLLVSFRERLDRSGFDVRVIASESAVIAGPRVEGVSSKIADITALPSVAAVQRVRLGSADVVGRPSAKHIAVAGVDLARPVPWTRLESPRVDREEPRGALVRAPLIINRNMARTFGLTVGSRLALDGRCGEGMRPLPVEARVAGIAEFQNDATDALTAATSAQALAALCGENGDLADMLLVRSNPSGGGPDAAAAEIRAALPGLHVLTNDQIVERFGRVEFSYFRQLSSVLTAVTLFFGLLLIAVLLTVSVNRQLGEMAALRALGFSRARVMAGVLCESALLIGIGGAAAIPVGGLLSIWLDHILRSLPGIPADARFFVFTSHAVAIHVALLAAGAVLAALYPMRLVAVLPIAATLRREVVS